MPPQVCIHLGSLLLSCGIGWQNCWRHHRSVTFLASRFLSTFCSPWLISSLEKKMNKNILVENFESYGDAIISCWCIWFILCDVWDDVSPNFFLKMKCSWSPWQRLGSSIFFLVLSHWFFMANMMSTWFSVLEACFWSDQWRWSVVVVAFVATYILVLAEYDKYYVWMPYPCPHPCFFSCWVIAIKNDMCQFLDCCEFFIMLVNNMQ